jgi:hypothetical protein
MRCTSERKNISMRGSLGDISSRRRKNFWKLTSSAHRGWPPARLGQQLPFHKLIIPAPGQKLPRDRQSAGSRWSSSPAVSSRYTGEHAYVVMWQDTLPAFTSAGHLASAPTRVSPTATIRTRTTPQGGICTQRLHSRLPFARVVVFTTTRRGKPRSRHSCQGIQPLCG